MYRDLREFVELVDQLGALRRIRGADVQFEIGGITEVAAGRPDCPALLFDAIEGFPRGFRMFTNAVTTPQRAALALGLDPALRPLDALKAWMEKRKTLAAASARLVVEDAAFLENAATGADVDLAPLSRSGLASPRRRTVHRLGLDRRSCAIPTAAGSTPRSTACRCMAGTV